MSTPILAIDFGTSNTAAAVLEDGQIRRIPVEKDAQTLPTAVFFPADGGAMQIGAAASRALISGEEGRYMRALKSVLGTELLHEQRPSGKTRRSLSDIVTAFLAELKRRAEAVTGQRYAIALSGRPVRFHSEDTARDARALEDLRGCYLAAGFDEVEFLPEPEAAALASHAGGAAPGLGLIVDIGGGTSDFTLFRSGGRAMEVLASRGVRIGGTDFDHALSMRHVMPLLGLGGELRREMGTGLLPVPTAIFTDLARWEKIPFLYTPDTRRAARGLETLAVDRAALGRLVTVLDDELGHDLAFAVETGKIAANSAGGVSAIALGLVEPGLSAAIGPASMADALAGFAPRLQETALETVKAGGVGPEAVDSVILVGGSSLMTLVSSSMAENFPAARLHRADAFTAVVDGLALATGRPARAA